MAGESNTEHVDDLFSGHAENSLSQAEQDRLTAHLAGCQRCRDEFAAFQDTLGALSGLESVRAPDGFRSRLERKIEHRSAGRFFGRKTLAERLPFFALAIIALVLAIVVTALVKTSDTGSSDLPRPSDPEPSAPADGVVPRP